MIEAAVDVGITVYSSSRVNAFATIIRFRASSEARRRGPRSTCCGHFVQRLIGKLGVPHVTIALRTIVESRGNEGELTADVIGGVSDLVRMHPRWVSLGLAFIEAFDQISLARVRMTAKATGVQPMRDAIMTLLCVELDKILGPSKLPKPPKPARIETERKPPRALTRVPGVEAMVALGFGWKMIGYPGAPTGRNSLGVAPVLCSEPFRSDERLQNVTPRPATGLIQVNVIGAKAR